jgi:hypothetical protein
MSYLNTSKRMEVISEQKHSHENLGEIREQASNVDICGQLATNGVT